MGSHATEQDAAAGHGTARNDLVTTLLSSRETWAHGLILLFWGAILLGPRLPDIGFGGPVLAKLRLEDLLAPFMLAYVWHHRDEALGLWGKAAVVLGGLWVLHIVVTGLVGVFGFGLSPATTLGFLGKEIEYLLFFTFLAVFASRHGEITLGLLGLPALVVLGAMVVQLVTGNWWGYYGIGLPFEVAVRSPSAAGAVAAILFVLAFAGFLLQRRIEAPTGCGAWVALVVAAPVVFLVLLGTVSRTSILAGVAGGMVLVLYALRTLRKRGSVPPRITVLGLLVVGAAAVVLFVPGLPVVETVRSRMAALTTTGVSGRVDAWLPALGHLAAAATDRPLVLFTGTGLGSPGALLGPADTGVMKAIDNQYLRRLFEVGILGTALWLGWLLAAFRRIHRLAAGAQHAVRIRATAWALLAVGLVLGVGFEALQVIRSASMFYAAAGMLLGLAAFHSTEMARGGGDGASEASPAGAMRTGAGRSGR